LKNGSSKTINILVPVIPVDYFNGYHIMQLLKIKSIVDNFAKAGVPL
jgi:hypothetical protein